MKKIALATLLALVAVTASAVEVGAEYQNSAGKNGTASTNNYQLFVKGQLTEHFAIDLKDTQSVSKTTDGVLYTGIESGITGKYSLGYVSPYARVAIGEQYKTTTNFTYYSVEPGIYAPIASTGAWASVGYRFREGFNENNNFTTRTWRAKLGYNVTPRDNVYVGYDSMRGNYQSNIGMIGYGHSF
jgi:hypothetical protein